MKKLTITFALAVALTGAVGALKGQNQSQSSTGNQAATPQTPSAAGASAFQNLDVNGDGIISQEEFGQFRNQNSSNANLTGFQSFDTNGDGQISREEFGDGTPGGSSLTPSTPNPNTPIPATPGSVKPVTPQSSNPTPNATGGVNANGTSNQTGSSSGASSRDSGSER